MNVGDSVTTDHISPAGAISRTSPAAKYLQERGLKPREFNSYGSRRGNDRIMARGTFANIRLVNKFMEKAGPYTLHFPSNEKLSIFDAAMRYKAENVTAIILAGKEYGSGSSRDWAAKGPWMQGVRAVLAESYERIHRFDFWHETCFAQLSIFYSLGKMTFLCFFMIVNCISVKN